MKTIQINNAPLKVTTMKTKASQAKGLMHFRSLACNYGALFEYPSERILKFWMKNTTIPLSIAFIDKQHKIIEIVDMEPLSEKLIKSSVPAMWALETNQGWFADNKIKIGDKVEGLFSRGIKIRVLKLPPKAQAVAKKVEDALVAMTKQALGGK